MIATVIEAGAGVVIPWTEANWTQAECVFQIVSDGRWRTIHDLCEELARAFPGLVFAPISVSTHLRKLRQMGFIVDRRIVRGKLYEYCLTGVRENA